MKYTFKIFAVLFLSISTITSCTSQSDIEYKTMSVDLKDTPAYKFITDTVNGELALKDSYKYLENIDINSLVYKSDGLRIRGFVVKPKAPGNYPCIIYNRGGNRDFGELKVFHALKLLAPLADKGYIVIASNYRGSTGSEGQDEFGGADVNDVLNLIPILDQMEGADSDRIGLYGWSRGATMTYLALSKSDRFKAAVAGAGVSNYFDAVQNRPAMEDNVYGQLMPEYTSDRDLAFKKRSAVFFADQLPKDVPILLLHGNADWRVKSENSLKLALELEKHKIPYRLKIFEGADHGINEFREERDQDVLNWFNRYLKNDNTIDMEPHGR